MRENFDTVYCDENCHINIWKSINAAGLKFINFRQLNLKGEQCDGK